MNYKVSDPDDLLGARAVRDTFSVSDMTLWRWTRHPVVRFPEPDVVIRNRRYWRRRTIDATKRRLAEIQEATKTPAGAA